MDYTGATKTHLEDFEIEQSESAKFDPSQFFVPGWKGDGLITAHGLQIKSILNNLTIDATSLFKKLCSSSPTIKKQTFSEFLLFANWAKLDLDVFKQPNDFWIHLQDETSPYQDKIQEFVRIYCFRAAAIYLFRIKFILEISKELNIEISEDILFNPLSFLGRIFKKDSSTELNCESLQINQYSWYRPTLEYKDSINKIHESFSNVTITELIKLLSTPKDHKIYSLKNYSHSLSHLTFGLFINDLLIQFPKWMSGLENKKTLPTFYNKTNLHPKTISTHFEGNHVSSLALSHWLAQESNIKRSQWDNLICPEFKGQDFIDGTFLKICQELQFLCFLTKIAIEHRYEVVPFICKTIKEKNFVTPEDSFEQISFLNLTENASDVAFNRIVLNLTDLPKTNPHHHLIQQILPCKNKLKKDGVLFVLTNQKLFVPSHHERVELLMKDFKILASFNLDELKGKGEIPNYIYVLDKRTETVALNSQLHHVKRVEKETCYSFILKGVLARFNKFNKIVEELDYFVKNKKASNTPIYTRDIDNEITFDYHIDAIIEGKLVSAANNKENGQTAHPAYFKNLTNSSVSFDTFFHIENLDPFESSTIKAGTSGLLGINLKNNKNFSLLMIVNQTNPANIEIELVSFESFKAKVEENGTAFFTYLGLSPKHNIVNLNVFREYFNSNIGFQIIQMQLADDGPIKLKGKIKQLLIPRFFAQTQFMPQDIHSHFKMLENDSSDLLKMHPDELNLIFKKIESKFNEHKRIYPWHLLGLLSFFKVNLKSTIANLDSEKFENCQFSNPIVSEELTKLKNYKIYPKNDDVFIDIIAKAPSDIHLPLTSLNIKTVDDNHSIILKSGDREIITMYASYNMILFIKFILLNAIGIKISDLLLGLRIPKNNDLEIVLAKFSVIKENKNALLQKIEAMISHLLQEQIIN